MEEKLTKEITILHSVVDRLRVFNLKYDDVLEVIETLLDMQDEELEKSEYE